MSDDKERPDLSPNQARVYRNYLLTCRRLGIMPTSPERAKVLLDEWAQAMAVRHTCNVKQSATRLRRRMLRPRI